MKWKSYIPPKYWTSRVRVCFAWFPIECEDGNTHWLKRVIKWEVYTKGQPIDFWKVELVYPYSLWQMVEWTKFWTLHCRL